MASDPGEVRVIEELQTPGHEVLIESEGDGSPDHWYCICGHWEIDTTDLDGASELAFLHLTEAAGQIGGDGHAYMAVITEPDTDA